MASWLFGNFDGYARSSREQIPRPRALVIQCRGSPEASERSRGTEILQHVESGGPRARVLCAHAEHATLSGSVCERQNNPSGIALRVRTKISTDPILTAIVARASIAAEMTW